MSGEGTGQLPSHFDGEHERPLRLEASISVSEGTFQAFAAALDEPALEVPELVRLFRRVSQIPTT